MPHDAFFKRSLQNKALAIDFFKAHLPGNVLQKIDFRTLKLTDKSFVRKDLKAFHSDVIYAVQIDGNLGYLYVLIEHQSSADELMAFRKHQYCVMLMDQHLAQGYKKLPLILPVCLYHGKKSPYPYSTDIMDCFQTPNLAKEYLFQPFHLIDLTILSEEEIQQHGLAALMEMLFKHYRARNVVNIINRLIDFQLLQNTVKKLGVDYLETVLKYLLETLNRNEAVMPKQVLQKIAKALPGEKEKIMTLADQLRFEGMEQGIQDGIALMAKNMLQEGIDFQKVVDITGLDEQKVKSLAE